MNPFESIIESMLLQNEMTPEKRKRIDLGLSKAEELFEKYRAEWEKCASAIGWKEDFRYLPNVKVENIEEMTNEEWLESRKQGIGGSEAGTILGLNKHSSVQDLAIKKLAIKPLPAPTDDQQYIFDFGHQLEPALLRLYEAKSGNAVFTDRHQYVHSKVPYMLGDCDGLAITPDGEPILLELKSFNYNLKDSWTPGIYGKGAVVKNPEYIAQVRHYLSVLNLNRADIVAICGNMASDLIVVTVYRDINFEKDLIDAEGLFWDDVENFVIPESYTMPKHVYDSIRSVIVNEAPEPIGKPVEFTEDMGDVLKELAEIADQKTNLATKTKLLEERESQLRSEIIKQLGKETSGYLIEGDEKFTVTYKGTTKKGVDMDKLQFGYPEVYNAVQKTTVTAPVFRLSKKTVKKR